MSWQTVLEQRTYEAVLHAADCITNNLPRLTEALESIAKAWGRSPTPPKED